MMDDFWVILIVSLCTITSEINCGNCMRFSLLSITRKIIMRVVFNRHITFSERKLSGADCLFKPSRTLDMIFAIIKLQENCIDQIVPLYSTTWWKSFNREALWTVLERIIQLMMSWSVRYSPMLTWECLLKSAKAGNNTVPPPQSSTSSTRAYYFTQLKVYRK